MISSLIGDRSCVALRRRSSVTLVTKTPTDDAKSPTSYDGVRLRLDVYDRLAHRRGATTPTEQAELHGISRGHMYRLRTGAKTPRLDLAMRIASDLGTTVEKLFEVPA